MSPVKIFFLCLKWQISNCLEKMKSRNRNVLKSRMHCTLICECLNTFDQWWDSWDNIFAFYFCLVSNITKVCSTQSRSIHALQLIANHLNPSIYNSQHSKNSMRIFLHFFFPTTQVQVSIFQCCWWSGCSSNTHNFFLSKNWSFYVIPVDGKITRQFGEHFILYSVRTS